MAKTIDRDLHAFGGLSYDLPGQPLTEESALNQLLELLSLGFDGLKILEGKPDRRKQLGMPLHSPLYDAVYGYCEAHAIPILAHVGDSKSFWDPVACPPYARKLGWYYGDGTYPTLDQLHSEMESALRRFPRLTIMFRAGTSAARTLTTPSA